MELPFFFSAQRSLLICYTRHNSGHSNTKYSFCVFFARSNINSIRLFSIHIMIALDSLGVNKLFNNCLFYGEFSGQMFIRKIGVIETKFLSLALTLD